MDPIRQDATLLLDRLLSGARQVSVVGHTHPDGDALGSVGAMTAYLAEKRGLTVRGIFPDTPPETLRFLCREDFLYADAQREASLRFIGTATTSPGPRPSQRASALPSPQKSSSTII